MTILEPDPAYTYWKTARNRNLRIGYELMLTPMLQGLVAAQQHQAEILEQCPTWIDQGKLNHLSQIFPLEQASITHQLLQTESIVGKIVLVTSVE
jgi:NADPH2:quinone reductase